MPGPPPTPNETLKLRGSWRANKKGDAPAPNRKPPTCPQWMDAVGRAEFRRVVPILRRMRTLDEGDRAAIVMYCQTWQEFVELVRKVKVSGTRVRGSKVGTFVRNPDASLLAQTKMTLIRLAGELGLTPSTRQRIRTTEDQDQANDRKRRFFAS